ncbi:DNA-binding CsgD family transcriptional regulator [Actinopolyspora biskrensis]|uniref:DNA-binding CsgD family transcriptional regulator n=1 Tax=Actinopolyspora biskrensis TaxID=1470178 RepID=A0A852YQR2_9ACTN|nr:helix-turn-helix transcriptional regulator [Actinopolyspora biskrensis]NYH77584.1 DNA-binding CsgD family transcriptional regulator [Actinopolyspora biskrensis]
MTEYCTENSEPRQVFGGPFDDQDVEHGYAEHGFCPASRAIYLLLDGTRRTEAVELAELALAEYSCQDRSSCVWYALLTLLYSDELLLADAHCTRLKEKQEWSYRTVPRMVLLLVEARICHLSGAHQQAFVLFDQLLRGIEPNEIREISVAWFAESLVSVGQYRRAEWLLADYGYLDSVSDCRSGKVHLLCVRGVISLCAGKMGAAVRDYVACDRLLSANGVRNGVVVPWRTRAACVENQLGRTTVAKRLVKNELSRARVWGAPSGVARALCSGVLLEEYRNPGNAANEAIGLLQSGHNRSDLPMLLTLLGKFLSNQNDIARGRQFLRQAIASGREFENEYWVGVADSALGGIEAPRKMTSQEFRVCRLASAGYSNGEIADKLSLTRRAIEYHLTSVYSKHGISGRREIEIMQSYFDEISLD